MYSFSPYDLTMQKLDIIINTLEESIKSGNYLKAEEHVASLREYNDCYYCIAYRKDLLSRDKGVCDNCPIHKIGEQMAGRPLAYNGCYKTSFYREMVRLSWYYKEEPCYKSATELIKAIKLTKKHMEQYKKFIAQIVYKGL
jgi:hypothetical protein